MAIELATGYVSLIPSADGFTDRLRREISGDLDRLGTDLGRDLGRTIAAGADGRAAGAKISGEIAAEFDPNVGLDDIVDTGSVVPDAGALGDDAGEEFGDGIADGAKGTSGGLLGGLKSSFLPGIGALAAVAGAALAAGVVSAFTAGLNQTRDTARLAGQLGLSPAESARIAKDASAVYVAAWGDSIGDVNAAIRSVDQNLDDVTKLSSKDLRRIATGALAIADVFEIDVNEATRTAGTLIRNGLARDADEAFDLITAGFQGGLDKGGDFLDTLNEYAEPLSSLGLTGRDSLAVLNSALEYGAFNADKAGDALKEFSIRAVDGSKATGEAFQIIGLDADTMANAILQGGPAARTATSNIIDALNGVTDPVKRETAGVALFGATWEDLGGSVISVMNPAFAEIGNVDGALQNMIATQDTSAAKFESWKREIQQKFVDYMANTVIPFINAKIIPALDKIKAAFDKDGIGGAVDEVKRLWAENWPALRSWLGDRLEDLVELIGENAPKFAKAGLEIGKELGKGALKGMFDELKKSGLGALTGFSSGNMFGWAANIGLSGGRADGGPVRARGSYLVGEDGPEILTIGATGGWVDSNDTLASMASSTGGLHIAHATFGDRNVVEDLDWWARTQMAAV